MLSENTHLSINYCLIAGQSCFAAFRNTPTLSSLIRRAFYGKISNNIHPELK